MASSSTTQASLALSELARTNSLGEMLALLPNRADLNSRLKALGYTKMGTRSAIEVALRHIAQGTVPDLQPAEPWGGGCEQPIGPWIIATHAREDVAWMVALLHSHPTIRIIIYECGIEPLPDSIQGHDRVMIRDKSGHLAPVPFFYGVFDFCASHYEVPLPEHVLFIHGHDTGWHQKFNISTILPMCGHVLASTPDLEYINLNDKVMDDWILPGGSMVWRVALEWESRLSTLLGETRFETPRRLCELHSAQALVHRNRLRARPREAWLRLRAHAASIIFHSEADLALEGAFHRIFGEPWCRPFVEANLARLLDGSVNELELRAIGADPVENQKLRGNLKGFFPINTNAVSSFVT